MWYIECQVCLCIVPPSVYFASMTGCRNLTVQRVLTVLQWGESNYIQHQERQGEREKDRQRRGSKREWYKKKINGNTSEVELNLTVRLLSRLGTPFVLFFPEAIKVYECLGVCTHHINLKHSQGVLIYLFIHFVSSPFPCLCFPFSRSLPSMLSSLSLFDSAAASLCRPLISQIWYIGK